MATTTDTFETDRDELPINTPSKITPGDTYIGDIIQHRQPDNEDGTPGDPIDTSAWTFPGAGIYANESCSGAAVVLFTMVHLPGPDFGYYPTLTREQTADLSCSDKYFYEIPTVDPSEDDLETTYVAGNIPVSRS